MHPLEEYFKHCLYFTANSLARVMGRLAEEEFAVLGLSPSQAFLVMLVLERPGMMQKDLAAALHLKPSTVTRMVDALEARGLVARKSEARAAQVSATRRGRELGQEIEACWKGLYERYAAALGKEEGDDLCRRLFEAAGRLEPR